MFLDHSLDPTLRSELIRRVKGLDLNPFEEGMDTEAQLARDQYAALRAYATAPDGLERKLDRDRAKEVAHDLHSKSARVMFRLGSITTLGIYKHNDPMTPELLAEVDRQRRFAWHQRFLEEVIGSRAQPEVAYNIEQIQHSLDAVTEIAEESDDFRARSEQLVRRVLAQTSDVGMRQLCQNCLQKLALQRMPKPAAPLTAGGAGQ